MNWYKVAEIIIGPIVSLIIMFITLWFEKVHNKNDLEEQRKNFKKSLEIQESHYTETQKATLDQHRISIMPYLILENVEIGNRLGNSVFNITLKNIGNNIATSVCVVCCNKPNTIHIDKLYSAKKEYIYTGFLFDNILQTNATGNFEIMLICDETGIIPEHVDTFKGIGSLKFTINFCDIQMNKYTQSFFFQYNILENKYPIGRQETYQPILEVSDKQ